MPNHILTKSLWCCFQLSPYSWENILAFYLSAAYRCTYKPPRSATSPRTPRRQCTSSSSGMGLSYIVMPDIVLLRGVLQSHLGTTVLETRPIHGLLRLSRQLQRKLQQSTCTPILHLLLLQKHVGKVDFVLLCMMDILRKNSITLFHSSAVLKYRRSIPYPLQATMASMKSACNVNAISVSSYPYLNKRRILKYSTGGWKDVVKRYKVWR